MKTTIIKQQGRCDFLFESGSMTLDFDEMENAIASLPLSGAQRLAALSQTIHLQQEGKRQS